MGGTTTTKLQNDFSTCPKLYYDKETSVMIYQSVDEFYTCLFFKFGALPQYVVFLLDVTATFLTT